MTTQLKTVARSGAEGIQADLALGRIPHVYLKAERSFVGPMVLSAKNGP